MNNSEWKVKTANDIDSINQTLHRIESKFNSTISRDILMESRVKDLDNKMCEFNQLLNKLRQILR